MEFTIRKFKPEEITEYMAIRLEALQSDPGCFGNPYEKEAAYDTEVWRQRLESPSHACFGLYDGDMLIGLTSIFSATDRPGEGCLTQSYIRRQYRGRKLSAMLYDARIEWAIQAGLSCLVVGHRASNLASKGANQRYGFRYSHRELRHWPDGSDEEMLYYKLELDAIVNENLQRVNSQT